MVEIYLFAALRDAVGCSSITWPLDSPIAALTLFQAVADRYPSLKPYAPIVKVAVNEEYSTWDTIVGPGDQVAFLPPVSGG